ncbi:T9SS type A sorting domain-containing protein [Dyadobacter subterraneus]|uniref:T9SS type A sorting domain-containing protein n=1 Tax=Dyadobacter subterraneus TaxID=2773304 RepID=A0ABR9W5I2_9BACT|nr:T9SS type A sorting domain-containing protein [Dyadobacter subterraneus]MBE9460706.1 T9SS type A sorting domain-containing protein [Dyadobacter subterraneus]
MIDKDETFAYSRIVSLNFGFIETISVFPNPATDLLQINMKDWNKVKTVKLVDLNGNTVYSSTKSGLTKIIDVKSLIQGMYVMEISGENGKISANKIVISK